MLECIVLGQLPTYSFAAKLYCPQIKQSMLLDYFSNHLPNGLFLNPLYVKVVLNWEKFPPVSNSTLVLVVQVHDRLKYLRWVHNLISWGKNTNFSNLIMNSKRNFLVSRFHISIQSIQNTPREINVKLFLDPIIFS